MVPKQNKKKKLEKRKSRRREFQEENEEEDRKTSRASDMSHTERVAIVEQLLTFMRQHDIYRPFSEHRLARLCLISTLARVEEHRDRARKMLQETLSEYPYPVYDTCTGPIVFKIYKILDDLQGMLDTEKKGQGRAVRGSMITVFFEHGRIDLVRTYIDNYFQRMGHSVLNMDFPWVAFLENSFDKPWLLDHVLRVAQKKFVDGVALETALTIYDLAAK